jgi:hypothetical protein
MPLPMSIYAKLSGMPISEDKYATLPSHSSLAMTAKQRKPARFAGL